MSHQKGLLVIFSAPTGVGKTTVAKKIVAELKNTITIKKAQTYTTRPPRSGEIQNQDYVFVSNDNFIEMKVNGAFWETTTYDGYSYGSPKSTKEDVLIKQEVVLMVTDRPGALTIKKDFAQALLIWLTVPSIEIIKSRLAHRGSEQGEAFERRVALAQEELVIENQERLFDLHIQNIDLDETVSTIKKIILAAVL